MHPSGDILSTPELDFEEWGDALRPEILLGIRPTGRKIEVGTVAVVLFRDDKICGERIYWDHASVLQQASLL